ncbi:Ail/Lom family outer membrane beta-barrel protein [Lelliottia amnigena]|jgi:putative virulence related protein PagC|uniref:Ail/Lom family outer membrane beta-barrel protein n=1 Tax=Lelliottia amnigena TaxID=61646 RepID=A0AAP2AIN0_LELAM|nr:Ail/Lom family outer membrane beta-barrel protein [Lelliottia amnigena]MBL5901087.1 Ail/Lom family outer membrane beta-barrel protein [Lelliottia amnigena]MBL5937132.1 Ail/Lom family outer membrane beta-barrel protein [Lelliottia amnigena]MBL5965256.1 Ail/Lom family outer membrane beta-barrel protein [Lelliottia amnigena]MBM7354314.1 putative virulence related protein PagC [Lelliottia amnigena]MCG7782819.1 Ail/Lom family outer membrane beta-barrel protein [Lelliottia amnigena]
MKHISLAVFVAASLVSGAALADNHTVSLGYAQSKVENFKNIRGVNAQYRYEWDSPLSVMGSFTYMSGDEDQNYFVDSDSVKNHIDVKYYSLMAGPAYRINEYVSLYALGGVARTKADGDTKWVNAGDGYTQKDSISEKSTSFAYGAGVQFNPTADLAINVGYEGTNADLQGDSYSINGWNLGVGYRF